MGLRSASKFLRMSIGLSVALGSVTMWKSPVQAAAPNTPTITDVAIDYANGEIDLYFNAPSGGAAVTGYVVELGCPANTWSLASTASPLVLDMEDFTLDCNDSSTYSGFDDWMNQKVAANQPWAQQTLSLYATNNSGRSASAATKSVKPKMLSFPQVVSTTPVKGGCLATYSLRSIPPELVTYSGGVGALALDDANVWSVTQFPNSFDLATRIGKIYVPYEDPWWNTGAGRAYQYLDEAFLIAVDGGYMVGNSHVGVQGPIKSEMEQVSCPDDPSGPSTAPVAPTLSLTPRAGGFTLNWSTSSTGSHPIWEGNLVVYSSTQTLNNTNSAPTSADLTANCLMPDWQAGNLNRYSPYCTSPMASSQQVYIGTLESGSIDSSQIVDNQNWQPMNFVLGRTYWFALHYKTMNPDADLTKVHSESSNLVELTMSAAPTVTAVNPTSGSTAGGTAITITGTNFANGATVTVGGSACTNVSVVNATEITCTTPAGTTGTASVVVTAGGQSNAANTLFTYIAPPPTPPVVTAPPTTAPPTTLPPGVPSLVNDDNQEELTQAPGGATAIVNGQPVAVEVQAPADLPAANVDPEDRTPAQVEQLRQAANEIVDRLADVAGENPAVSVVPTPTGAVITGLLTENVPVEDVVLVETPETATLFAALNGDGTVTEVNPGGVIQVLGDGTIGVLAYGLTPGETVELVIMSDPQLLGSFEVNDQGEVKVQAGLPDGLGAGNHTLVVASPTIQASLGLQVAERPITLPVTGGDTDTLAPVLVMLSLGAILVVIARRRITLFP